MAPWRCRAGHTRHTDHGRTRSRAMSRARRATRHTRAGARGAGLRPPARLRLPRAGAAPAGPPLLTPLPPLAARRWGAPVSLAIDSFSGRGPGSACRARLSSRPGCGAAAAGGGGSAASASKRAARRADERARRARSPRRDPRREESGLLSPVPSLRVRGVRS